MLVAVRLGVEGGVEVHTQLAHALQHVTQLLVLLLNVLQLPAELVLVALELLLPFQKVLLLQAQIVLTGFQLEELAVAFVQFQSSILKIVVEADDLVVEGFILLVHLLQLFCGLRPHLVR